MPLLDHFHPPLSLERPWESFHAAWAGSLADALNRRLPEGYFTEEQTHAIDVLPPQVWAPPAPALTLPAVFADDFEVRVFATRTGPRLVAAIELISPRNKDRPEARQAFAIKCASYLHQGVSLILIDIVTERHANLHNELLGLLGADPAARQPDDVTLYAAAYRPVRRQEREEIDLWRAHFALGGTLPVLPLALSAEVALPVDLEATCTDACQRRRLA
jgi:hypothetical protein